MLTTVDDDRKPRRVSFRGGPFLYLYLCGPRLDRAPSGSVGEAGQSIGLSCAHGPGPLSSPLPPVLSSYPCAHFTSAAGGLGGASRAGLRGRPPNGPLQTAMPLRCESLGDRLADETASTGPNDDAATPLLSKLTSRLRQGSFGSPFSVSASRRDNLLRHPYRLRRHPYRRRLHGGMAHKCSPRHRMAILPA
jgi:hypothetical protein